ATRRRGFTSSLTAGCPPMASHSSFERRKKSAFASCWLIAIRNSPWAAAVAACAFELPACDCAKSRSNRVCSPSDRTRRASSPQTPPSPCRDLPREFQPSPTHACRPRSRTDRESGNRECRHRACGAVLSLRLRLRLRGCQRVSQGVAECRRVSRGVFLYTAAPFPRCVRPPLGHCFVPVGAPAPGITRCSPPASPIRDAPRAISGGLQPPQVSDFRNRVRRNVSYTRLLPAVRGP